jgi:hypothetical protein
MNEPPERRERKHAPPGFRAQSLAAIVFTLLAAMIWWTSRTVPDGGPPAELAGDVGRGLLVPFVLAAFCAAINALAIHRGRTLQPALRAAPLLVFVAALVTLRLLG